MYIYIYIYLVEIILSSFNRWSVNRLVNYIIRCNIIIIVIILAMGPILPFLPVYGKQLGVSPLIMGSITAILPILFLIAKPAFGFIVDYFHAQRKIIFIILLTVTSGCYILMYFLPVLPGSMLPHHFQHVSCASLMPCEQVKNYALINVKLLFHNTD